jgi:beta-lactamase regulating signal transducer with metallopeptidase domain
VTLSYLWRLFFLCAATFFVVHTIAALAARFFVPSALRFTRRMQPRSAAQFLLAVRLAPAAIATFAVLALCIPSYLSFEAAATREEVGLVCLIAAFLTAALLTISFARGIRALVTTNSYARTCLKSGMQVQTPTTFSPITVIDAVAPVIAMVGAFRPQFIISRGVLETLSPEELDCAIRHERAHRTSADNFKRLLLLLAPDVLPFLTNPFSALDLSWITFSEWAADDSAVANDLQRSLSLAGALVHVAQMGAAPRLSPLCTSLVSGNSACMNQDLSARVDRLLHTERLRDKSPKRFRAILAATTIATACAVFVALLRPETLHSVHELLEFLTH